MLDIKDIQSKRAVESKAAARWYNGLERSINALASYPNRCPFAPEVWRMSPNLRHLLYGKKRDVYRVIYAVDERRRSVWVLTIRHGAGQKLKRSDLV